MRILVIGDIHGNYKGLSQCLERSNFNNDTDTLISLGDVVDGHCDSFQVVEELLKIKNLIAIKGNHDDWFLQWLETGINPSNWKQDESMNAANIWNLDTGGGSMWKISIMDINTKEFWQSDKGNELYPEFKGR